MRDEGEYDRQCNLRVVRDALLRVEHALTNATQLMDDGLLVATPGGPRHDGDATEKVAHARGLLDVALRSVRRVLGRKGGAGGKKDHD
jgi:hypothetical protein